MKKIRILTYHFPTNNGAFLQAHSLSNHLKKRFVDVDVKIFEYIPLEMGVHEFLRIFNINYKKPLFGLRRYLLFKRAVKKTLDLDSIIKKGGSYPKLVRMINESDIDAVITGSDCIWRIEDKLFWPKFPNIYWFSDKIKAKKISYAASAFNSNLSLAKKNSGLIKRIIDSYSLVGVRDKDTMQILERSGVDKEINKIPDPTFLSGVLPSGVLVKITKLGIDPEKPILALLAHGEDANIKQIVEHFKRKKFQIVALSMLNPYADFNLGDEFDPFEWAEFFKYSDFTVTDRFHGTIYALKNKTPVISIELGGLSRDRSKKFQMLKDMGMTDCYMSTKDGDYSIQAFIERSNIIERDWKEKYVPIIKDGLVRMRARSSEFDNKIANEIGLKFKK